MPVDFIRREHVPHVHLRAHLHALKAEKLFRRDRLSSGVLCEHRRQVERKRRPLFRETHRHTHRVASGVYLFEQSVGTKGEAEDLLIRCHEFEVHDPDVGWVGAQLYVSESAVKVERGFARGWNAHEVGR